MIIKIYLPNGRGGWTPLRPLRGLQENRVATREDSGVLGFPSRRGLTPRGSLECNPEIPAFPGFLNDGVSGLSARSILCPKFM